MGFVCVVCLLPHLPLRLIPFCFLGHLWLCDGARVERVCIRTRSVFLSALDLVDGTPVLDVKPYVPLYDTIPEDQWRVPDWIVHGLSTRASVDIPQQVGR